VSTDNATFANLRFSDVFNIIINVSKLPLDSSVRFHDSEVTDAVPNSTLTAKLLSPASDRPNVQALPLCFTNRFCRKSSTWRRTLNWSRCASGRKKLRCRWPRRDWSPELTDRRSRLVEITSSTGICARSSSSWPMQYLLVDGRRCLRPRSVVRDNSRIIVRMDLDEVFFTVHRPRFSYYVCLGLLHCNYKLKSKDFICTASSWARRSINVGSRIQNTLFTSLSKQWLSGFGLGLELRLSLIVTHAH